MGQLTRDIRGTRPLGWAKLVLGAAVLSVGRAALAEADSVSKFYQLDVSTWQLDEDGNAIVQLHDGTTQTLPAGTFQILGHQIYGLVDAVSGSLSSSGGKIKNGNDGENADASEDDDDDGALLLTAATGIGSFLTAGSLLVVASAGGGGGVGAEQFFSGTAVKGPLGNAFVFLDTNDNGTYDAGEAHTTTNERGYYEFRSSSTKGTIIVTTDVRTIDAGSGTVLCGVTLKTNLGSSVATPLTTIMIEAGLTSDELKSLLGLNQDVDLSDFNPYETDLPDDTALAIEKASIQVLTTFAAYIKAAEGADADAEAAYRAAIDALSDVLNDHIADGKTVDLTDADTLNAFQEAFEEVLGRDAPETLSNLDDILDDLTNAIETVNDAVGSLDDQSLTDSKGTFGLTQLLLDEALAAGGDGGVGAITLDDVDEARIRDLSANLAPTDILLSSADDNNRVVVREDTGMLDFGLLSAVDADDADGSTAEGFRFAIGNVVALDGSRDGDGFEINDDRLQFNMQPDFEVQSSYEVTIGVWDPGGKLYSETFYIEIEDSDNDSAPMFTSDASAVIEVAENTATTTELFRAAATDADGDEVTYSLGGASVGLFNLINGVLTFKTSPDYEMPRGILNEADENTNQYVVDIIASDGVRTRNQQVTIDVENVNDNAPVFTSNASAVMLIDENTATTTELFRAAAIDADGDEVTYSLGGASVGRFNLINGVLTFKASPDYENPLGIASADGSTNTNQYVVDIIASDGVRTSEQQVTINVTDATDPVVHLFDSDNQFNRTGWIVSDAGDFNNNGIADFLIGAWDGVVGTEGILRAGAVYVIYDSAIGDSSTVSEFASRTNLSALDGTNGFAILGLSSRDYLGDALSYAGDVNDDGIGDIVIGAQRVDIDSDGDGFADTADAGAAYVIYGAADQAHFGASFDLTTLNGTNGFVFYGDGPNQQAGRSVASAGDFNGDGIDDLVVAALNGVRNIELLGSELPTPATDIYLIFGSDENQPATMNRDDLTQNARGLTIVGATSTENTDQTLYVSSAGDFNGDGKDDLLIGSPETIQGVQNPDGSEDFIFGATYVIFGKDNNDLPAERIIDLTNLSEDDGFTIRGVDYQSSFGSAVSSVGDINGDGVTDLIVGASLTTADDGTKAGAAYVIFGGIEISGTASGYGSSLDVTSLNGNNGFALYGGDRGDGAGVSVSAAGDINGDGIGDIIVGAFRGDVETDQGALRNAGKSYIIFGKDSGFDAAIYLDDLDGSDGFAVMGADAGDFSSISVSGAGDVNDDGFADILVGAYGADYIDGVWQTGETYLIMGQASFEAVVMLSDYG